ncbi:MAG TPA: glycoside hydrolase family 15 protein [Rhizomicrobium sp.]|nr:glycoside hydrolase family 15 protein [Rhizomicrobium sp.]
MSSPIEDYAVIGNCETIALVGINGSIDWLCLPRFDSGACFAALLGDANNGRWLIAPCDKKATSSRRYSRNTLVLETIFQTAEGRASVTDFMFRRDSNTSDLVRVVRGLEGHVPMLTELIVRFEYGSRIPWVTRQDDGRLQMVSGPDRLLLSTSVPLRGEDMRTIGEFDVRANQSVSFSLSRDLSYRAPPETLDAYEALERVKRFWTGWTKPYKANGQWSGAVLRSLLTLKALSHWETGGIVAAGTTSLPEEPGGQRNWDYRYCWLRDATYTLYALVETGFLDEARAWREWLLRAAAGSPQELRVIYGVAGERSLDEFEIPWLSGYEGSRPVRVGNAAANQVQLDVYGEILDTLYVARKAGLGEDIPSWGLECALIEHLEKVWELPDEGIWEMRGGKKHFTHSKVMAWVAFDRAVRSAQDFGMEAPVERWASVRDRIHASVCKNGYDPQRQSFVQYYGSTALDAALLLIPLVGFLPPGDPRVQGTLAAIERDLLHDGFVRRYNTDSGVDGLPAGEGAFLACSFWLVDNYVLQDRYDEALALFERLLSLCNDVGLLAEEYDTVAKRQVGNFPQAFSHLALINSARNLMARGPADKRATGTIETAGLVPPAPVKCPSPTLAVGD